MNGKVIQKFEYDKESRVLSLEISKSKSVDSDIRGNIVIDYNKKGRVVKINIYEFSFEDFKSNLKELKKFSDNFNLSFQHR